MFSITCNRSILGYKNTVFAFSKQNDATFVSRHILQHGLPDQFIEKTHVPQMYLQYTKRALRKPVARHLLRLEYTSQSEFMDRHLKYNLNVFEVKHVDMEDFNVILKGSISLRTFEENDKYKDDYRKGLEELFASVK